MSLFWKIAVAGVLILYATCAILMIESIKNPNNLADAKGHKPLVLHCDGKIASLNIEQVLKASSGTGVVYKEKDSNVIHGLTCKEWKVF